MRFNSQVIALLFGLCVMMITTIFLSLVPETSTITIVVVMLLSFSSSFLLIRLLLEYLFFRQIEDINKSLKSIEGLKLAINPDSWSINPLKKISNDISTYAMGIEKEIEHLKEQEAFRREFVTDVAHELKTPLFAAQGFVHTLLDGAINDKDVRKKFLKKAAKSLDALDLLVQDILTVSLIEIGEIKMHMQNFDINHLVNEVIDQLEQKVKKKEIQLIAPKTVGVVMVKGDYHRIYQVMINLLMNAIRYTRKGGYAKVKFEVGKDLVTISVEDNGKGIPANDVSRIFERFYRVDKSRARKKGEEGGTGLGLSIVKHILERHNTDIRVKSEFKKGSKFYFTLQKAEQLDPLEEKDYI